MKPWVKIGLDHMTRLFGKAKSTINEHIKNIFAEWELDEDVVVKKFGISEFQQKASDLIGEYFLSEKIRMYRGDMEQMSLLEFNPIGFALGLNASKGIFGKRNEGIRVGTKS